MRTYNVSSARNSYVLKMRKEKDALLAVLVSPRSGEHPFKTVSWKDGELSMRILRDLAGNGDKFELIFTGKRSETGLTGTLRAVGFDQLEGSWSATKEP